MTRRRILDEDDVYAMTESDFDEVDNEIPSGWKIGDGDGDYDDANEQVLPDDYEGDVTDEDIDAILNS